MNHCATHITNASFIKYLKQYSITGCRIRSIMQSRTGGAKIKSPWNTHKHKFFWCLPVAGPPHCLTTTAWPRGRPGWQVISWGQWSIHWQSCPCCLLQGTLGADGTPGNWQGRSSAPWSLRDILSCWELTPPYRRWLCTGSPSHWEDETSNIIFMNEVTTHTTFRF
jgi:hypothetical protein